MRSSCSARPRKPARAAKLTRAQVSAALKRARRRNIPDKATAILAALRSEQLGQPEALTAAYAATVRSLIAVVTTLNEQVKILQGQVEDHFGRHPDAEVYLSQPGMGKTLGARVLGEFGDAARRYRDGKARRNYAATSPLTRASGKKKVVAARFIHNDRLVDALNAQAFAALAPRLAPAPTTTSSATARSSTMTPSGGWRTVLSASCTDASRPAPSTTRPPRGDTGRISLNLRLRLDI